MRFGNGRGLTLAIALVSLASVAGVARADWFTHAIPKETPAMDYRTGGQYYAPPIPYGHYAKDGTFGMGKHIDGLKGHLAGLKGHGSGLGHGDGGCANCGDGGNGHGHGHGSGNGLFGGCANGDCGGGGLNFAGHGGSSHMFGKKHFGQLHGAGSGCDSCGSIASAQSPAPVVAAPQAVVASSQASPCGLKGCGGKSHHHHGSNAGCGLCGGNGFGIGGHGFGVGGHGNSGCGMCGGRGCGACGGFLGKGGNSGCGMCGGRGCNSCMGGLGSKAKGALFGLLHPHAGKVKYFVGAGGPVPITPGYVNYVNPVRSPRDFLAFPPFSPVD